MHSLQAEGERRVQRFQPGLVTGLATGLATSRPAHLQPSVSCCPGAGGSALSCSSREVTTAMGLQAGEADTAGKSAASISSR